MTYAFMSYSRDDSVDPYLFTFYADLKRELAARGRIAPDTVFVDTEQRSGTSWPVATGTAVAGCQVFVPVYSPHYFASVYCGQEWSIFAARATTPDGPLSIVPVWWVPPLDEPPPCARHLMDTRDQFGPLYRRYGLRYLLQLKENESTYRDFLVRFTEAVLASARDAPPAHGPVDLRTVPNAFAATAGPAGGPGPARIAEPRLGELRRVTFIVAAAGLDEMRPVHDVAEVYGEDWEDWRPYHPDCPDRVVLRAQDVANRQRAVSGTRSVIEDLFGLLDQAERRREMVVILIDPWVLGLARHREILERLNHRRPRDTAVLVLWERLTVRESRDGRLAHDRLRQILENWAESGEQLYRDDILSVAEFEQALGQALLEVTRRIVLRADRARRVAELGPLTTPVLTGPGG